MFLPLFCRSVGSARVCFVVVLQLSKLTKDLIKTTKDLRDVSQYRRMSGGGMGIVGTHTSRVLLQNIINLDDIRLTYMSTGLTIAALILLPGVVGAIVNLKCVASVTVRLVLRLPLVASVTCPSRVVRVGLARASRRSSLDC